MPSPPLSLVQSLSPRIAVLTSDDVVDSCEANGCQGLEELLRPWESAAEMVQIMSSTLTPAKHPTFPLRFVGYSSVFPHPESSNPNPDLVVDLTSSLVGSRRPDEELHYPITRALLLSSRPIAGHETFNHPVGILLAVSTSTPDPLGSLQRLQARAMGPMSQVIPWMDGLNVFRFYVVVHDVSKKGENLEEAYDLLAGVKKAYGPHSTLLVINSQATPRSEEPQGLSPHPSIPLARLPVQSISQTYASALSSLSLSPGTTLIPTGEADTAKSYGARLSGEDVNRLMGLVRELVTQSLVPWMEARVREWNEVWHSNRRGITGRLFGAGRKFFSSRPNSPSPNAQQGYNAVKGYYSITSIEALSRRLADFAFMLRDYRFASTVYDSLRRDFAQDRAWRYAAAATEMYGLSLLLSHSYFHPATPPTPPTTPFTTLQHTDISSWLEQAVIAYQGRAPANQIQLDALRVTILYYEAWKMIGEWRGVSGALVKAAGDAEEVPCAVMMEEAAAVNVRKGKQGRRRRAFHLVLAARRYETTGLKTFSRRCLDQASEIYRTAPWTAAQDLIEYSLGRQAYTLGESNVAVEHFLRLLSSGQPRNQTGILEDLKLAYEQLQAHPDLTTEAKLPINVFDPDLTRIVLPHASTSRSAELEAVLLASGRRIRQRRDNEASMGESFTLELVARNPVNARVVLSNITIATDPALETPCIDELVLQPLENRIVSFPIQPADQTAYNITSVSFLFHRFFPCTQPLEKRGKRLHGTKAQRLTPTYAKDTSLTVSVGPPRPRLDVTFEGLPDQMYLGERVSGSVAIYNSGNEPVNDIELFTTDSGIFINPTSNTQHSDTANRILGPSAIKIPGAIKPGDTMSLPVTFSALATGLNDVRGMVIYGEENAQFGDPIEVLPLVNVQTSQEGRRLHHTIDNISDELVTIQSVETISPYWTNSELVHDTLLYPNQSFTTISVLNPSEHIDDLDLQQSNVVKALGALIEGQALDDMSPIPMDVVPAPNTDPSYLASRTQHRLYFLRSHFDTLPVSSLRRLFPLFDPLDLDVRINWSIPSSSRNGSTSIHGLRVSSAFSIVEGLRRQVDEAIAKGGKATRVMYEETGRIRHQLMTSILDGIYAQEDQPIKVTIKVPGSRKGKAAIASGCLDVSFELENLSPAISARWILRLLSDSSIVYPGITPAHFTSQCDHRGTLGPGQKKVIVAPIWVDKPGIISLDNWELQVETGTMADGVWDVRRDWTIAGEGDSIQVVGE